MQEVLSSEEWITDYMETLAQEKHKTVSELPEYDRYIIYRIACNEYESHIANLIDKQYDLIRDKKFNDG